jgi:hypothetical protein
MNNGTPLSRLIDRKIAEAWDTVNLLDNCSNVCIIKGKGIDPMKPEETTQKVYQFIANTVTPNPSLAEIALGCGLASRSVALYHIRKLAERGEIIFVSGRHRSIRLPEGGKQ